jgi:hypothetical protein
MVLIHASHLCEGGVQARSAQDLGTHPARPQRVHVLHPLAADQQVCRKPSRVNSI